mgnify:CR=1 FL=1
MCVTLSTADDFEELTELWEASVRATHHFIPEQYILKLKPLFIFVVCLFTRCEDRNG